VAQRGRDQRGQVLLAHVQLAASQRAHLRAQQHGLSAARARAVAHVLADRRRRRGLRRIGREQRARDQRDHVGAGRDLAHQLAQLHHPRAIQARRRAWNVRARGGREDRHERRVRGRGQLDLEQEAVELRLGQRVRALHLDRVLGGGHEEGLLELEALAEGRDLALLHGLEQRRLRARRGAVDLVGQDHVAEDRPAVEHEAPPAALVLLQDPRPGDVGRHQVGRELDAAEHQVERVGRALDERGLAQARRALEQHVPAGEEG
jgi:hypothetical protein